MLMALLRKDVRLLQSHLLIGLILLVLSYVLGLAICWILPIEDFGATPAARVAVALSGGALCELVLAGCACALVSGNAFTAERMDQSARFLDYLPPTRGQIVLSKAIVVIGFMSAVVLVALCAAAAAWALAQYTPIPENRLVTARALLNLSKILACITGVGWATSSIAKSNGAPILLGLFSPLVTLYGVKCVDYLVDLPVTGEALFDRVSNACLLVGTSGFVLGCYWYLHRRFED